MRGEPRLDVCQRRRRGGRGLGAAGEDRDGAAVVRAGRERAADGQRHPVGPVLAAEHQHVDHLPRGLRAPVAAGQRGP